MTKHTILFLAANPVGTNRLALDQEARAIQLELERSGYRDRFELVTWWAAEPQDLLRELRKHRPTIVHFSGHGKGGSIGSAGAVVRDLGAANDGDGEPQEGLYFQRSDGQPQLVSTAALEETFCATGDSVKLVVLSACFSKAQAAALARHVKCVVGVAGAIRDDAAQSFATGFYGGLGEGESFARAFQQGRAAMSLDGLPHSDLLWLEFGPGADASESIPALDVSPGRVATSRRRLAPADARGSTMTSRRLVRLCESEGLETNHQTQWMQIGPVGTTGPGARDSRIFYVSHSQDIADLRRSSGPADLLARAVECGGVVNIGQIVARIPLSLFSEEEWIRLIRYNL